MNSVKLMTLYDYVADKESRRGNYFAACKFDVLTSADALDPKPGTFPKVICPTLGINAERVDPNKDLYVLEEVPEDLYLYEDLAFKPYVKTITLDESIFLKDDLECIDSVFYKSNGANIYVNERDDSLFTTVNQLNGLSVGSLIDFYSTFIARPELFLSTKEIDLGVIINLLRLAGRLESKAVLSYLDKLTIDMEALGLFKKIKRTFRDNQGVRRNTFYQLPLFKDVWISKKISLSSLYGDLIQILDFERGFEYRVFVME